MQAREDYGWGDMDVNDSKEFIAPTFRDKGRIRAAAWGYARYHDRKFTTKATKTGIIFTRIK